MSQAAPFSFPDAQSLKTTGTKHKEPSPLSSLAPPRVVCKCPLQSFNAFQLAQQHQIRQFVKSSFFSRPGYTLEEQRTLVFQYFRYALPLSPDFMVAQIDPENVLWTHVMDHILSKQEKADVILGDNASSSSKCDTCPSSPSIPQLHGSHKAEFQSLKRFLLSPLIKGLGAWHASCVLWDFFRLWVWRHHSLNGDTTEHINHWTLWSYVSFDMSPVVKSKPQAIEEWMRMMEAEDEKYISRTEKWTGPLREHNGYLISETCDTAQMKLDILHGHPRDGNIAFDCVPHTYWICGVVASTSTTALIHSYFQHFDPDATARKMLLGHNFPNAEHHQKYHDLPIWCRREYVSWTDILVSCVDLDRWEKGAELRQFEDAVTIVKRFWLELGNDASTRGTKLHRSCELFLNDIEADDDTIEFQHHAKNYFKKQWDMGYRWYRSEQNIYDEEVDLGSQVDAQFLCPPEIAETCNCGKTHLKLIDWKRSKAIKFQNTFGQKGIGLLESHDDLNSVHYYIQLNVYARILQHYYDVHIMDMWIVVFSPVNDDYLEFQVPDLQDLVGKMFMQRRKEIEFRDSMRKIFALLKEVTVPSPPPYVLPTSAHIQHAKRQKTSSEPV